MTHQLGDVAVVIGGSIAGLTTARVLADHYRSVVVIDRDELPTTAVHRKGTPQSRHVHALLPGGRRAIESLVPGFSAEVVRQGGLAADYLHDADWHLTAGRLASRPGTLQTLFASRPLLETTLRRLVREHPRIEVEDSTDVLGLAWSGDRVTGVRTIARTGAGVAVQVPADLVVDASGRTTRLPRWLADRGWATPPEEQLRIDHAYVSGAYRLPPTPGHDWVLKLVAPRPGIPTGSACALREDGLLHVTVAKYGGDTHGADVLGWAQDLADPTLARLLAASEPAEEERTYRTVANLRRRYGRIPTPAGVLAVGDAIAHFNPAYGQGMTVAALEAKRLREQLRTYGDRRLAERFYPAADRIVDQAWQIVTTGDGVHPWIEGHDRLGVRLMIRWLAAVHRAGTVDPAVSQTFASVAGFVAPPSALLAPTFVARVVRGSRRARVRTGGRPVADSAHPSSPEQESVW
jgi:2-polyprenyl-6-methoxyphenol hydroxylase-like FAD-dependent oxidoreductase